MQISFYITRQCVSANRYAPNKLSKIAWKEIENGAPDLFSFIQSFSFRIDDYNDLMRFYAQHRRFDVKMDLPESYVAAVCRSKKSMSELACDWLHHEKSNR